MTTLSGDVLKMEGLDDMEKWLENIDKKKDSNIFKFLRDEGNNLRKEARSIARIRTKRITGRYNRDFDKDRPEKFGIEYSVKVYNKAPHAHLLESGHKVYRGDPKKNAALLGEAPGLNIMADSFEIYVHRDFLNHVEDFYCNTILGDK